MKKITRSCDCDTCLGCCKFLEEKKYFAPIFTSEEIEKIKNKYSKIFSLKKNQFIPFKTFKKIKQIKLNKKGKYYYCPFYNLDNGRCLIYHQRPFDCKIYPFILVRNQKNNKIELHCFNKSQCLSINNINKAKFKIYSNYLLKFLKSPYYKSVFKKYPGLAWPEQDTSFFVSRI